MTVIDLDVSPGQGSPSISALRPMTIEAEPDARPRRVFVQLTDTNGFAVVDFAARKEIARITLPVTKTEFEMDAGRTTSPSHGIRVARPRDLVGHQHSQQCGVRLFIGPRSRTSKLIR